MSRKRLLMRRAARLVSGGGPAAPNITDITFAPGSSWTTATAITMTPTNVGGTINTYAWVFRLGGTQVGTSSAPAPTYTFPSTGVASAEVTVSGPGGGDFYSETIGTISAPGGDMFAALPMGSLGAEFTLPPWDPVPYVDLMRNSQGFHTFGANGSGAPVAVDANGDPTAGSWSAKLMENAGRGTAPVIPLGAWQVRATPRVSGTPGTWSLGIAAGGSLTDFNYNSGTNTVTANLNITDPQAVLVIRATEPCTGLRIIRPGYSIDSEQILHNEALAYTKQYATLRQFNRAGLNTGASASAKTWAQWPAANIRHGVPGWGELCKTFREVHEASGSKCKFFSVNAPPYWGDADYLSWAQFLKANLLDLVPTAGLLVGGPNELWNSIYPTLHYLVAQVNGYSIAVTGDTVVQMSRPDRVRICAPGRGNAWRAVTSGSHSAGATVITVAAGGAGEGSIVIGDSIRFAGHGSNYTISAGLSNVATGGTITISPGLTETVPAASGIELNTYDDFGRWWALREARMWKIFRDVFGADWGARVFGMCHTHFMNPYWHQGLFLPWLNESAQVAEFGAINTYIHGIGGAPYPGLDIQSYFDAGSAQNIVDRLSATTQFHPGDVTVAVINTQLGVWTGIRNTYGIAHQYNYEIGCEHLGYVPNVPAITGEGGGFYVNPFAIAAIRSANFKTQVGDALFAAVRANNVRVLEVLNPMPSSYVSKQESIDRGNPNLAANSHWGSVDAQIAATYAAVWSIDTGQKAQALRDHMLAIGQLP